MGRGRQAPGSCTDGIAAAPTSRLTNLSQSFFADCRMGEGEDAVAAARQAAGAATPGDARPAAWLAAHAAAEGRHAIALAWLDRAGQARACCDNQSRPNFASPSPRMLHIHCTSQRQHLMIFSSDIGLN